MSSRQHTGSAVMSLACDTKVVDSIHSDVVVLPKQGTITNYTAFFCQNMIFALLIKNMFEDKYICGQFNGVPLGFDPGTYGLNST